ncbi:helix-turn-helix transcriptional regulator [Pseudoflavonifractor phocaeensis]|uniref:helix-turn-helix transcriptional regulator n=1 Tax=Pseudoflavonifractor phocaeensis TaxID=1870988 RepID=UPI00195BB46F|nr:helix-turn-helix transcriptional regulator [Pseudoflavonifractor phocaeensis]MBM6937330.1 helix-turn-helix transcriptional regulator [Pseudoflavonifractor phocaeensis]
MEPVFLPGDLRTRIVDLMKYHKISQADLAVKIGVTESTLNRFLTGKVEKLGHEQVLRLARTFQVSTDFLLGLTEIPDRKNYEISELGLSVEAAKNLYLGKVQSDVVNRLLESPRFAEVTYLIGQYLDDTLAEGYALQNQMMTTLRSMLMGAVRTDATVQAAREVNRLKVPPYQADLTTIQNQFMAAVREVKQEVGNDLDAAKSLSKAVTQKMFTELTKGQDMQSPSVTPEQIAQAVTSSVSGMDGVNLEALNQFGQAIQTFLESTLAPPASHTDEEPDQ